jgi:hypothetical protein
MTSDSTGPGVVVGAADHGNTAFLVSMNRSGVLLDRRQITLTRDLSTHPYHHEGAWAVGRYLDSPWSRPISLEDAVALIKQVHQAAELGARQGLDHLAAEIAAPIAVLSLRHCPALPATIEERIADNRAQLVADGVMYRQSLAQAATARGWSVQWYDADRVMAEAGLALGTDDIGGALTRLGRTLGPPWQAKHKLAAAAAIVAGARYSDPTSGSST